MVSILKLINMEKRLIKLFFTLCIFLLPKFSQAQKVYPGLYGFDATYYYKDAYGVEWIGTGSSGGVYYKNKFSWIPCNDPFGPGHIYWIGEIDNQLVVNCDLNLYILNRKKFKWSKLQDPKIIENINKEINIIDSIQVLNLIGAINNDKIIAPKRTNSIFISNNDSIIFCTELGLVYYNLKNKSYTKANIMIEAADVVKVQSNNNSDVFCLTHEDKIWKLQSTGWKQITDYSLKYDNALDFFELNLKTLKKNHTLRPPFNLYNKKRAFSVSNNKIVQLANSSVYLIDMQTGTSNQLKFNYSDNIFDIDIKGDSIIFLCNLENVNDVYSADFIITKLIDDHWVVLSKSRCDVFSKSFYGLYPSSILDINISTILTPTNQGYYSHHNKINKKVLSYCISNQRLFLGTYGSGVVEIDYQQHK